MSTRGRDERDTGVAQVNGERDSRRGGVEVHPVELDAEASDVTTLDLGKIASVVSGADHLGSAAEGDVDRRDPSRQRTVRRRAQLGNRDRALEAIADHPAGVDEVHPGIGFQAEGLEGRIELGIGIRAGRVVGLDVLEEEAVTVLLSDLLEDLHRRPAGPVRAVPRLAEVQDHGAVLGEAIRDGGGVPGIGGDAAVSTRERRARYPRTM
jgi:hypothetical protein